ncbi:chromatin modification- protein VID21 [Geranomyces michiganensis]|nr:chromatin modification- protein VID21 [Geranomyces michiganensis]
MSSNEPAKSHEPDSFAAVVDIDFLRSQAESARDRRANALSARHDNLLKELFIRESNLVKPENLLIELEGVTDEAKFEEFRTSYRQSREQICDALWSRDHGSQYAGDDADGRADPNNTSAHPHKRRALPPPERMVTRGISAKKLAFSPETPTGPLAPTPNTAPQTATAASASTPSTYGTRRRSSIAPKPVAATITRPAAGTANAKVVRSKGRDAKPEQRRRLALKTPVVAVPEANSELGGYRWYEWQLRVQNNPIGALLPTANKTLTTKDWQAARNEAQQMALLSRVEQLKEKRLWSFRQLKPFVPPCRNKTNWDSLLDEMERRWKLATAYTLAHWVAEWHASDDKASLCVPRFVRPMELDYPPPHASKPASDQHSAINSSTSEDTADLAVPASSSVTTETVGDDQSTTFMDVTACLYVIDDGSANHVLDIPTYIPPRPDEVFVDENQHKRVVPFSRLLSERRVIDEATRWEGVDESTREPVTPTIQNPEPDTTTHIPLFGHHSKDVIRSIPPPEGKETYNFTRPNLEWSKSEEADLAYLAATYHYNWTMVVDMLYSRQLGPVRWRRTEWECYRQYEKIGGTRVAQQAPSDPQKGSGPAAGRVSASAEPDARIAQHFVTMESIRKLSRNKERYKPPGGDRKPPTKVVLTTHDTHYQAQTQAAIDPIGPPLTPADLAHMKRARALHAQEQGRQIYGAHQRGTLIIGRTPPTGLPMPLPYNQFRGLAVRPPLPLQPPGPALPPGSIPMLTPQQQMHPAIRPPTTPLLPGQVPQSPSMARMNGSATPMTHEQYLRAAMMARQQMVQQQQQQASNGSPQRNGVSPQGVPISGALQINDSPAQSSPSPGGMSMQPSVANINARLHMVRQYTQQQQQQQLQQGQQQHTAQQIQQLQALQQQGQRLQLQQQMQSAQQLAQQQLPGIPTQQQQPQLSALPSPRPQQPQQGPGQLRQPPQSSPQRPTVQQIQQNLENLASAQQRAQVFSDAPHTAAAFVALQNAQQVAKMGQMTPEMIQQQQRQVQQPKPQPRPGSSASTPPVSMASTPHP